MAMFPNGSLAIWVDASGSNLGCLGPISLLKNPEALERYTINSSPREPIEQLYQTITLDQ